MDTKSQAGIGRAQRADIVDLLFLVKDACSRGYLPDANLAVIERVASWLDQSAWTGRNEIYRLIDAERDRQDAKWGTLAERDVTVIEWIVIAQKELTEALSGWMYHAPMPHDARSELVQVAAVAVACLEQHTSPKWRQDLEDQWPSVPEYLEGIDRFDRHGPPAGDQKEGNDNAV